MVSDGRHNRPSRVEDIARRFGILDAPVGVVATGSADPPRDASVLDVKAPEAIHLGDKMRVTASLKFDGYKGKQAKVKLMRGDEEVESRELSIPQDHHREEKQEQQDCCVGQAPNAMHRSSPFDYGERWLHAAVIGSSARSAMTHARTAAVPAQVVARTDEHAARRCRRITQHLRAVGLAITSPNMASR